MDYALRSVASIRVEEALEDAKKKAEIEIEYLKKKDDSDWEISRLQKILDTDYKNL